MNTEESVPLEATINSDLRSKLTKLRSQSTPTVEVPPTPTVTFTTEPGLHAFCAPPKVQAPPDTNEEDLQPKGRHRPVARVAPTARRKATLAKKRDASPSMTRRNATPPPTSATSSRRSRQARRNPTPPAHLPTRPETIDLLRLLRLQAQLKPSHLYLNITHEWIPYPMDTTEEDVQTPSTDIITID